MKKIEKKIEHFKITVEDSGVRDFYQTQDGTMGLNVGLTVAMIVCTFNVFLYGILWLFEIEINTRTVFLVSAAEGFVVAVIIVFVIWYHDNRCPEDLD